MTAIVSAPLTSRENAKKKLPEESIQHLSTLLERRRKGYSLEGDFYTDPAIFQADMQGIFGQHWIFLASLAEVPEPGDYVTLDVGPFPLIVLRREDGGVNVLHNICRHRGARVLGEEKGSTGNLVCGYHSWTYNEDGELIHASTAPHEDLDKSCFSLKRAHVRVVAGLIFACLATEPPTDFDDVIPLIEPYLEPHEVSGTKVAFQQNIVEEGNWKLVMENNRECYPRCFMGLVSGRGRRRCRCSAADSGIRV